MKKKRVSKQFKVDVEVFDQEQNSLVEHRQEAERLENAQLYWLARAICICNLVVYKKLELFETLMGTSI